jgi:NAD(P)-dependent dehydrogenase (short-subunit alcohol dehydrogenase family)
VARGLALSRARVLVLSRKVEHGEEAVAKIKETTTSNADVEFIAIDLGDLNNVRQVADRIREKEERLDLVCFVC